jgi:hypothetical protein
MFNQLPIWSDLSYLLWEVLKKSHTISLKPPIYQWKNYLSQIMSVLVCVLMWGEQIINPLHHLQIQLLMYMFSRLRNVTTKIFNCYFETKLTLYFTSHLCIARNLKPHSVHHVFRTVKQISTCASKSSKWWGSKGRHKRPRCIGAEDREPLYQSISTGQLGWNQKVPGNVYAFIMFALCLLLEWVPIKIRLYCQQRNCGNPARISSWWKVYDLCSSTPTACDDQRLVK